jgi:hypothetical protein
MCSVEWSGSGAAAIRNKDFSYFSPVFLLGTDGTPDSLPEKGELGSLVNEPAFRSMPRIAAADASRALLVVKPGTATAEIEAKAQEMVTAGEASNLSDAICRVVASEPELYRASCGEKHAIRPEIEAEIDAMMERLEPSAHEKLSEIADELYLRGEAKSSTDAKYFAIERNPHLYQEMRDSQDEYMRTHGQPDSKPVKASDFESKAKALVAAGDAKDIDEAFGIVAASDPTAYSEYLKTLG